MSQTDRVIKAQQLGEGFSSMIAELTDSEVEQLFMTGIFDEILKSLLDPHQVTSHPTIAEFLLANKSRSAYIAVLQHALTQNYSFQGTNKEGETGFVSPFASQWFEDGVMFLEGPKPFEGFLGVYRDGKGSYAVASRSAEPGEKLSREDFEFIEMEEFKQRLKQIPPEQIAHLEKAPTDPKHYSQKSLPDQNTQAMGPVEKLQRLLQANDNDESKYQELLRDYPWVLGMEYVEIDRHTKLDDKNIPDFTGIRVHDRCRDIFEIKPPFMKIFRTDGGFTQDFNDAWNQAEGYLDFAIRQRQYLREKGLLFENPECYLIVGYNLSPEKVEQLRAKESRSNANIRLRTYDDIFSWMSHTVNFVLFLVQRTGTDKEE